MKKKWLLQVMGALTQAEWKGIASAVTVAVSIRPFQSLVRIPPVIFVLFDVRMTAASTVVGSSRTEHVS